MTTKYIYIETDHHANNKWGLLQPGTLIEEIAPDGTEYFEEPDLNPEQEFLHALRSEALKGVKKIVGKNPIDFVFLGDAHQGTKHVTQYVSQLSSASTRIMIENFRPIFKQLNIRNAEVLFGTAAHDGMGFTHPKSLVMALRAEFQKSDIRLSWHTDIDVDGYVINCAHHGSGTGLRNWLKGNEMRYYLKSLVEDYKDQGEVPPNLVLRGHFHGYHWETIRKYLPSGFSQTDMLLVPSLCGMGAFAKQVTKSRTDIINGSLLLEIRDGKLFDVHEFLAYRDLKRKVSW